MLERNNWRVVKCDTFTQKRDKKTKAPLKKSSSLVATANKGKIVNQEALLMFQEEAR
jgi:hypothetical protein